MSNGSLVDKIVAKHNLEKARKTDDSSPPAWHDFMVNGVFENIFDAVGENDTEICKEISNYVEAIRSSKDNMTEDIADKNSKLWYELLLRLEWIKGFVEDDTFPKTTVKWNVQTGLTWKDWFSFVCFLRRSKGEIIKNVMTKTIEELLFEQSYRVERSRIKIANYYGQRVIGLLRLSDKAPLKQLDTRQWFNVKNLILKLFKVDGVVNTLENYIAKYYLAALQLSAGIDDVLGRIPFVMKDKQFVDFIMEKDPALYLRLPFESKTQKNTDEASSDLLVLEKAADQSPMEDQEPIIPMKFRSSETFILNLFSNAESYHKPLKLLIPDGTRSLKDGDALFDRILQRIEEFDFTDFYRYGAPSDWAEWVDGHREKLEALTFDEKKVLLMRNPNIITFFTTENWFPIQTESNIVEFLEGLVIATGENRNNFAMFTTALIDDFYARDVFTYAQYLQLLHAHVRIANDDSARLQIIDEDGGIGLPILNIIETDRDAWVELLVEMVTVSGASALQTILTSFQKRDYLTKDVITEVLKTSNILQQLVNRLDGYALERAVDFYDFMSKEEFWALFEQALRSGHEPYNRDFIKLKDENRGIFPITVLATLYAAESSTAIDAEEATFRLLLLAIAKSPTDAGRLINGRFEIIENQPLHNATFRLRQEDLNILNELYSHYTQKHLE